MRFGRVQDREAQTWLLAADVEGGLRDCTAVAREIMDGEFDDLEPLRSVFPRFDEVVEAVAQSAEELQKLPETDYRVGPPIAGPGKILCVGLNYRAHAEEAHMDLPEKPEVFVKTANAVIGPGEPIRIPEMTHRIDFEGEIAVVIGRRTKDIDESEASKAIAGYTLLNDVTARDIQVKSSQWVLAKSFDSFAPLGPTLYVPDETSRDPVDMRVVLNGEVMQECDAGEMIFSPEYLVAYLSEIMTLEAGDVISTGTPAGIGFLREPRRYLQNGDEVSVESDLVGRLTNPVV